LLLPALARLGREDGWISWVAPPQLPYAPALAAAGIRLSRMLVIRPRRTPDLLWSAEQALRYGKRSAVLAWLETCRERDLRRLQLAAAEGGSLGVILRSQRHAAMHSPAALRVSVRREVRDGHQGTLVVDILKCRGGRPVNGLQLPDNTLSGPVPGKQERPGEHAFTNL